MTTTNPSSPDAQRPSRVAALARLWFGLEAPVSRRAYVASGVSLMALKYALEAALVYLGTGGFWSPFEFLNPILTLRVRDFQTAPEWLLPVLALLTLPFLWIGVSMSVRRAVDAGLSAWLGASFMLPVLNYLAMIVLAALPSKLGSTWRPVPTTPYREASQEGLPPVAIESELRSALLGVAGAVGVALAMLGVSVYALDLYGTALFFMTPFVMGAWSAFVYNRPAVRSIGRTLGVSVASTFLAGLALLLFALEGIVCLMMAFPIACGVSIVGALIGRAIASQAKAPLAHGAAMVLALPGVAGAESALDRPTMHEVSTTIEIDAPPERVWPHVIGFSELPAPAEWVFQTGIAFPMRARIEGEGVGAVRHCEFSTGAFVEPITAWEPSRRLAFDVVSQPPAMKEWSPFRHVHPPHLDASLRSRRGEFRLIPLDGGRRTRLEGSTWYELSMHPAPYWKVWTDALIHAIHRRVLAHVARLSTSQGR